MSSGIETTEPSSGPRSVHRALELLTTVVERAPISLAAVAREAELPSSTALRMLRVLEEWGYVAKDTRGHYVAGTRFAHSLFDPEPASAELLNDVSAPVLEALTARTGESSYLAVEGAANTCVYLREVQSPHPIRHVGFSGWEGRAVPMEPSAVFEVLTGRTPDRGFVVMDAVVTPEATVVAAPVRTRSGTIVAAISVVGPSYRIGPTEEETFGRHVIEAAADLSRRLEKHG